MLFLIDHNIEGYALILFGTLGSNGWLDFVPIRFIMFPELNLPINSDDRVVWRLAQANQMILLTANRSMKGKDSLEQTIREENIPTSLPVITIGNVDRLSESQYREDCAVRLVEIVLDIDDYKGVGRLFIP
ncbi:MAG: ACP S-malonyltransferase [Moorea sp. SIO2I5]|nr:ACP S-malonyltransferase [Moorena sp. SIO2I5]